MKIIDNFFSDTELIAFNETISKEWFSDKKSRSPNFFEKWKPKQNLSQEFSKIISTEKVEFTGVAWWSHDSSINRGNADLHQGLNKHTDLDVIYYQNTGKLRYPEKTFVFYPFVSSDFKGGELIVYAKGQNKVLKKIKPHKNRLVMFDSDLEHEILPFVGRRISVVLSPWKTPPMGITI